MASCHLRHRVCDPGRDAPGRAASRGSPASAGGGLRRNGQSPEDGELVSRCPVGGDPSPALPDPRLTAFGRAYSYCATRAHGKASQRRLVTDPIRLRIARTALAIPAWVRPRPLWTEDWPRMPENWSAQIYLGGPIGLHVAGGGLPRLSRRGSHGSASSDMARTVASGRSSAGRREIYPRRTPASRVAGGARHGRERLPKVVPTTTGDPGGVVRVILHSRVRQVSWPMQPPFPPGRVRRVGPHRAAPFCRARRLPRRF